MCLDGSPPAYHFDKGTGEGINNWLVHLEVRTHIYLHVFIMNHFKFEIYMAGTSKYILFLFKKKIDTWDIFQGGGWCSSAGSCSNRTHTGLGSSRKMKKAYFRGILDKGHESNPSRDRLLDIIFMLCFSFYNLYILSQ